MLRAAQAAFDGEKMIEEVMEGIYRIEVPLPIPVVGSVNCCIIADRDRNLIVVPGMAHNVCFDAMQAAVDELFYF
jgi:hypothetical protein